MIKPNRVYFQVHMVENTELSPPLTSGWLINKFFPGREQIKARMLSLFESGLITKLEELEYEEFSKRNPKRFNVEDKESSVRLTVEDIIGILIILFSGYFLSLMVFILETSIFVFQKNKD